MALNLTNGYQRKDSSSASNVYYGYSYNQNAGDGEKVFAIRRVNTTAGVETVTWTNGTPLSYYDSWSSRTYSFATPLTGLGLTCTSTTFSNGFYIASFTWSNINGVSRFVLTASGSSGILDEFGFVQRGTNAKTNTTYVYNTTSWTQPFQATGSYTFTVRGENVVGSTSSTLTINFS